MSLFKNKKGYTEAELMMVFALIALFGILCFTLIQAGGGAYERLAENRSGKSYARVALSYIENRVRQGDEGQSIMIAESPLNDEESALVITGITGIENEELWILKKDGELVEYYLAHGDELDPEGYFTIADIESFDVKMAGSTLQLTIGYTQNDKVMTQSRIILLRSEGGKEYE